MLKYKILNLVLRKIFHVYLKSINFEGVGMVNQFKSIYEILKRGERESKKIKGVWKAWFRRGR